MSRKLQKQLKELYPAPPPLRRESFLQSLSEPELSFGQFLWRQAGYIQKGNWFLAAGLLLLVALSSLHANGTEFRILAACTPFLALMTAAEGNRSIRFKMEELELSSRFSLKVVVAARLGILGFGNLLLLGGVIPLLLFKEGKPFFYSIVSLLLPYLLTAFLNLWIVRSCRGSSGIYLCMGIAALVSGACIISGQRGWAYRSLLPEALPDFILIGCTLLFAALTGYEYLKTIRQSEEYRWSLQ